MKLTLIFSDIEAGIGNATDDFVEDDLLSDTIRSHFRESQGHHADLVFNGDTFDYMKAPYKKEYPKHITEKISLWKTKKIALAHPKFFKVMHDWLAASENNRVVFVVGNHDYDLVFPKVQEMLKDLIAGKNKSFKKRVIFPGFEFYDGLLLVEHGSQLDQFFYVNPETFIHKSKKVNDNVAFLMLPWGYNALYDQYIYVKEKYPILERIIPRGPLFGQLPRHLKKIFIVDTFVYMVKSFLYTQYRFWGDPIHKFTYKDFKKYLKNFFNTEWAVKFEDEAEKKLKRDKKIKVMSVGHNHKSQVSKFKDKIILNTGCWRDEYAVAKNFQLFSPKNKSYAYVLHTKTKVKIAEVIEVASRQKSLSLKDLQKEIAKGDELFHENLGKSRRQVMRIKRQKRKEERIAARKLRKEERKRRREKKLAAKKSKKD